MVGQLQKDKPATRARQRQKRWSSKEQYYVSPYSPQVALHMRSHHMHTHHPHPHKHTLSPTHVLSRTLAHTHMQTHNVDHTFQRAGIKVSFRVNIFHHAVVFQILNIGTKLLPPLLQFWILSQAAITRHSRRKKKELHEAYVEWRGVWERRNEGMAHHTSFAPACAAHRGRRLGRMSDNVAPFHQHVHW